MSQFLDGIGKRLSDAGQGVAKHTKNFTEVTRLNGAIAEQERQAAALLRELGQACYDRHQNDPDYEYAAQIEGIRAAYAQIAQYQAQIRQIKGIRICPECGAEVGPDSAFCGGCGGKMEPPAAESGRVCPKCGSPVDGDSLFCATCGTRLE